MRCVMLQNMWESMGGLFRGKGVYMVKSWKYISFGLEVLIISALVPFMVAVFVGHLTMVNATNYSCKCEVIHNE